MGVKMARPIYEIASEIRRTWKKVNYAAVPYLDAMREISSIDDNYMYESAKEQVIRFLCNAGSYRGDDARRIKKELRAML